MYFCKNFDRMKKSFFLFTALLLLFACVPTKKYEELSALSDKNLQDRLDCEDKLANKEADYENLVAQKNELINKQTVLEGEIEKLQVQNEQLSKEVASYKELSDEILASKNDLLAEATKNQNLLAKSLAAKEQELNEISKEQAALDKALKQRENDLASSLEEIEAKNKRIEELETALQEKDNAVQNLKENIINSIKGFDSNEIQVIEKDGKLYVSLSEELLFSSGSFAVDKKGEEVLMKLSEVLKVEDKFQIVVEGHTDNVPYNGSGVIKDNWDLSVKRATSVVRILTEEGGVQAEKIIASGRGEFVPIVENSSTENKAKNRRTEIILTPKLDNLLEILNAK